MLNMRRSAGIAIALVSTMAVGCGKDDCERIYEMETKCSTESKSSFPAKEVFVAACKAAKGTKDAAEVDDMLACAKKSSCDEYKACGKGTRGKKRARKITASMADGKLADAWESCTLSADYYADPTFKSECTKVFAADASKLTEAELSSIGTRCSYDKELLAASAELATACKSIAAKRVTSLMAAATKLRDTGGDGFKECAELSSAAESAGGDLAKQAKVVCDEVDAGRTVTKGIEDAKANAAAKKAEFPYQCSTSPDELDKLGTPWAKAKRDEIIKACYVDLGLVVIAAKGADGAEYSCPYEITQVKDASTKYGLAAKYPELVAALAAAPKTCQ